MRERTISLEKRRAELLLHSARQREQMSRSLRGLDVRLHRADDRIAVARHSLTTPLVAGLVAAAWLALRRHAALGALVRAALLVSAARRINRRIANRRVEFRGGAPPR